MSKTQAGIAVGAYSGAVLLGSPIVGHWSARIGARRLTIFGVALLSVATLALAEVSSFAGLFGVRVGQGLSSAVSWTAGMAWLSEASPAGGARAGARARRCRSRASARSSGRSSAGCSARRTA